MRPEFEQIAREIFSQQALIDLATTTIGPFTIAAIDERTRRGEFLGGDLATKGYSTKPIATFKLGKLKSGTIRSDRQNTSADVSNHLFWRQVNGRPMSFLDGGYAKWRELTGRNTSPVDLTFTGRMLAALNFDISAQSGDVIIKVYVSGNAGDKDSPAHYGRFVNQRREFFGLSDKETNLLQKAIERQFE